MTTTQENTREVLRYVFRMMETGQPGSTICRQTANWLRQHDVRFDIEFDIVTRTYKANGKPRKIGGYDKPLRPEAWSNLLDAVYCRVDPVALSPLADNVETLSHRLDLTPLEQEILTFVATVSYDRNFANLCNRIVATGTVDSVGVMSICLDLEANDIAQCLLEGALIPMNLVDGRFDAPRHFGFYVPGDVLRALRPPLQRLKEIERKLLGKPLQTNLRWSDFDHMASARDLIADMLRGGAEAGGAGVHILLYGAPGTGKTELAKVIARKIEFDLFSIGESDCFDEEPDRDDRLAALRLSQTLAARRGRSILLFDEMEDLQQWASVSYIGNRRVLRSGSKIFFNRMLEEAKAPVIWTANSLQEFDPAFLRRMSFAYHVKVPPMNVRQRQWRRLARQHSIVLPDDVAKDLARRHPLPPSFAAQAMAAVAKADAPAEQLDFAVGHLARAAHDDCQRHRDGATAIPDTALLNVDTDLPALERSLRGDDLPLDVSFCFHGAPGTGKSLYARRLAEIMGLEVMEKRGSDLLSKWIGETEQLIARAFEEAAADRYFLIIDEAEGLFWRRDDAVRQWEASMVNEFLTWMERHPLPVACTTNYLDRMDPAALRRFVFKVKFDFMSAAQAELAFERFFDLPAPAGLVRMTTLTPSDFASVARKRRYLRSSGDDADGLLELLRQECQSKAASVRQIGF